VYYFFYSELYVHSFKSMPLSMPRLKRQDDTKPIAARAETPLISKASAATGHNLDNQSLYSVQYWATRALTAEASLSASIKFSDELKRYRYGEDVRQLVEISVQIYTYHLYAKLA
jgi:hypothetical protein